MKTKAIDCKCFINSFTLKDKDSYFRTKQPYQYYVEIVLKTSKSQCVVREFVFLKPSEAKAHIETLKTTLGI